MAENRYEQVLRAILNREPIIPPPLFEAAVGADVRQAFLGKPINSLKDDLDFWEEAGYAFYPMSFGLIQFGGKATTMEARQNIGRARYSVYTDNEVEMSWAPTEKGVISSEEEYEAYQWPDPDRLDLTMLDEVARLLPDGMRVLANIGKVFTGTWQLLGFATFAESLIDRPRLVGKVFERVAEIQARITRRVIAHPCVGAVLHADDLAYYSGLMVNPKVLREYVFPTYQALGDDCHQRDILYLFHSDGDIHDVIPDILTCGFVGLHPIEPKPMNAVDVKRQWGDRLCLLGHIDVDLLARGTPRQIRDQTHHNLDQLARDGGYLPGSGNSVPNYVPLGNYLAMLEAVREWR